nr:hypothetical protein [Tanacetum cinerariifolium]
MKHFIPGVAETLVPSRGTSRHESNWNTGQLGYWIEIARAVTSKEDMASQEILHRKTKRVKLNGMIKGMILSVGEGGGGGGLVFNGGLEGGIVAVVEVGGDGGRWFGSNEVCDGYGGSGRAGRWLPVKEEMLATCYVAVLEDNNVRRPQKHETFWYRVLNEFNSKNFQKRTKDMLTSKWHTLNANCQKFNAAYKRAKRLGKSGENDVDLMKRAQSIYRDEHKGVSFSQEDALAILKFHPKWDAPEQVDLTGDVPGAT